MTTAAWRATHAEEHRESSRKSYAKHVEKRRAGNRAWYAANRGRVKEYNRAKYLYRWAVVARLKTLKGCAACGYRAHHAALNFHHRNPAEKNCTPSALLRSGFASVRKEIALCDVLCANCHSIHHYEERYGQKEAA